MTNEIITTEQNDLMIGQQNDIANHPVTAYLAGMATERTRTVQRQALSKIAEIISGGQVMDPFAIDWAALRYSHMQAIRTALAEQFAAATANRLLSGLRGVLKAAFLMGLMSADDFQRAVMVKAVTGQSIPAGRAVSAGEIKALMADCENDPTPAGTRDAAIIAALYAAGLRRAELVGLTLADYTPATGALIDHLGACPREERERIAGKVRDGRTHVRRRLDRHLPQQESAP